MCLAFLSIVGMRVAAGQGEAGFPRTTFEELAREEPHPGDRWEIVGRYLELRGREVYLAGYDVPVHVDETRFLRKVLRLETSHETLVFHIECRGFSDSAPRWVVRGVQPGPPVDEVLRREVERFGELGAEGAPLLLDLAARIRKTEEIFEEPELRPFAHQAAREALDLRDATLPEGDVEARLEALHELDEHLKDRSFFMERLIELEARYPGSDAVRAELIELGARKYRGRWMTYAEFKSLQGYVRYRDRWVQRRERHFLRLIERYQQLDGNPILRRRLDREYQLLATRGKVAVGMRPEELYQAMGYPDRVYRKEKEGRAFSQWVYGETYYYLVDGHVVSGPDLED